MGEPLASPSRQTCFPQGAKSATWSWPTRILAPSTAVIKESVQYLSNTGYCSSFRRTTSASERETRVSVNIDWKASACNRKSSQVRGKSWPKSHLYCFFVTRFSFWCSHLFSRRYTYKWILHKTMFWLSDELSGNTSMCPRLYLLFQVDIFTLFSQLLNKYLKLMFKYYLFILPVSAW